MPKARFASRLPGATQPLHTSTRPCPRSIERRIQMSQVRQLRHYLGQRQHPIVTELLLQFNSFRPGEITGSSSDTRLMDSLPPSELQNPSLPSIRISTISTRTRHRCWRRARTSVRTSAASIPHSWSCTSETAVREGPSDACVHTTPSACATPAGSSCSC
jgi:hypothetical protein